MPRHPDHRRPAVPCPRPRRRRSAGGIHPDLGVRSDAADSDCCWKDQIPIRVRPPQVFFRSPLVVAAKRTAKPKANSFLHRLVLPRGGGLALAISASTPAYLCNTGSSTALLVQHSASIPVSLVAQLRGLHGEFGELFPLEAQSKRSPTDASIRFTLVAARLADQLYGEGGHAHAQRDHPIGTSAGASESPITISVRPGKA